MKKQDLSQNTEQFVKKHPRNLTEQPSSSAEHNQLHDVLSLVHQKDIKLKYHENRLDLNSSCALLSPDRLLLAYRDRSVLAVVNTKTGFVMNEKILSEKPQQIVVLPYDQAAVTFPLGKKILIIDTRDFETIESIPVNGLPFGITYHRGELYLLYLSLSSHNMTVLVLNLQGRTVREVPLDMKFSHDHSYIVVSEDKKSMYLTGKDALVRYSLHGERINEYQLKNTYVPGRPLILGDGSLLICCETSGTIHHISADLKQGYVLTEKSCLPSSMVYDPNNQLVYISMSLAIGVYSLKKNPK